MESNGAPSPTRSARSLSELEGLYSDGDTGITVNRLELVDGQLSYDVSIDLSNGDSADIGDSGIELSMNWILDAQDGDLLTWNLEPGSVENIRAEIDLGSDGIDGSPLIYLALCCLCLLVVLLGGGIAGYLFWRRQQASANSTEETN